jgi:hypothetical protein
MIIKIKQGAVDQDSWRFHDGVHEFSYATVDQSSIPMLDGVPHNEQMGIQFEGDDGIVMETHFIEAAIPEFCTLLSFIDSNGKPHEVYTDAPVYLLNDSGKTIERLA